MWKKIAKVVFCLLIVSVEAWALTPGEAVGILTELRTQIESTTNDSEAQTVLRTFVSARRVGERPGFDGLSHEVLGSERTCTCFPSCHDAEFNNPLPVHRPACACAWPGRYTLDCVRGTGRYEEDDDIRFGLCVSRSDEVACRGAACLTPCVEPVGYFGSACGFLGRVFGACLAGSFNVCSRGCPLWDHKRATSGVPLTRALIMSRIEQLLRGYRDMGVDFDAGKGYVPHPTAPGGFGFGDSAVGPYGGEGHFRRSYSVGDDPRRFVQNQPPGYHPATGGGTIAEVEEDSSF